MEIIEITYHLESGKSLVSFGESFEHEGVKYYKSVEQLHLDLELPKGQLDKALKTLNEEIDRLKKGNVE